MAGGGDHGAGPEDLGRAQDRAHVMRVGHPVEQDETRRPRAFRQRDVLEPAPVERAHLQRSTLMHGVRIEWCWKAARIGDLGRKAGRGDGLGQPVGGVAGDDEAQLLARGIGQRVTHRMQPEKPDGSGRRSLARALLLDDAVPVSSPRVTPPCASFGPTRRRCRRKSPDAPAPHGFFG